MIYAMSDLHGCYDKYRAMLSKIRFCTADLLYVLGDVIDRGADGIRILQDMSMRPNVLPILGNHEFIATMCLPWLLREITPQSLSDLDESQLAALNEGILNGGAPTILGLARLTPEEREDILEYLREMALYAEVEAGGRSFVLTHALPQNFQPGKPWERYELRDFLFGRPDPEAVYRSDKILVFGHTPTRLLWDQPGIFRRDSIIDIDCGCFFRGGQLGCLCLDTLEEFYL